MVLSNLMNLSGIAPNEVYKWFMETFIDSSDWVMTPNVFGMGLFSDGGIFATKPYLCGSNYLLKMSNYKKGEWSSIVDGLYWSFIYRHKDYFKTNHRLSMMYHSVIKMEKSKLDSHLKMQEILSNNTQNKIIINYRGYQWYRFALSEIYLKNNWIVIGLGRDKNKVKNFFIDFPDSFYFYQIDLNNFQNTNKIFDEIFSKFKNINTFILNAGIYIPETFKILNLSMLKRLLMLMF